MKAIDGQCVLDTIDNEGFGYAFLDYSEFEQIDDEEFHKLRKEFLKAAENLAEYLGVTV